MREVWRTNIGKNNIPCFEALSTPNRSSMRQACKAHCTTASFFLPETVTSATNGCPVDVSTGSLHSVQSDMEWNKSSLKVWQKWKPQVQASRIIDEYN